MRECGGGVAILESTCKLLLEGCSLNNHAKRVCHANSYDNNVTHTVSVVVVAMILQQMVCRINILHFTSIEPNS